MTYGIRWYKRKCLGKSNIKVGMPVRAAENGGEKGIGREMGRGDEEAGGGNREDEKEKETGDKMRVLF
jgi:hypothetical protein